MDLNYDIHTWDFSLRTVTLTKITQNVVEAAKRNPHITDQVVIISRANVIAENLDLLPGMITEMKKLIPTIVWVLYYWNKRNRYELSPILTPHGTVDVAKSARALIKNLPASRKFGVACDHCLEEEIFQFGKLLSKADKLTYEKGQDHSRTMQGFWYGIYKGNFSRIQTLNDLSPANVAVGLNRAMCMHLNFAIKYFLKKASQEIVQNIVNDRNSDIFFKPHISPDTIIMLLRIDQRDSTVIRSSSAVINTLLQRPYQQLFLIAAKTLVLKISLSQFWVVARNIIFQMEVGFKDYNYKSLFVGFWKMRKDYTGAYFNPDCVSNLLRRVLLMRDKPIAFMVFNDISERNKKKFLPKFNCLCVNLICKEDYKTLLFIMDVCKVKVKPLYIRFKRFVEEYCSGNITCRISPKSLREMVSTKEFKNGLHAFKKLMSDYESSEEPEQ